MLKKRNTYKLGVCLLWIIFLSISTAHAQVAVNVTGATPVPSAVLDVSSTDMGFLMPRMTTAQMNAIKGAITSLIIYNTTTNCYMFYNGAAWQNLSCTCLSAPASPGAITQAPAGALPKGTAGVTFSVAAVAGVSYNWSVPPGYTITAGQGTNIITVTIGCSSGSVNVTENNSCGISSVSTIAVIVTASSKTFSYTGGVQTFTVPPCVTSITVDMAGAQGGCDYSIYNSITYTSSLNWGGRLQSVVSVTPGTVLNMYVGSAGANGLLAGAGIGGNNGSPGPIGSGGNGKKPGATDYGTGGGGGASSEIWVTGTRCLVAGGGGGMGCSGYCMAMAALNNYTTLSYAYDGGSGGQSGTNGLAYSNNYGNGAVFPNTPGAASNKLQTTAGATAGTAGTNSVSGLGGNGGQDQGFNSPTYWVINGFGGGGGGGGGYAGGGGGCGAGGGGGSSFSQVAAGFSPANTTYSSGYQGQNTTTPSNGYITLSY